LPGIIVILPKAGIVSNKIPAPIFFIKKDQESSFVDIFPGVPPEADVIDLIKSLEVPIMRNALLSKYFLYLERYKDIISGYYKNKEKENDSQIEEDQGIGKKF
jgi:hypothetical protein